MALSGWQKIALLAGLPLTGILLYLLLRQQEDADDEPSRKQAMARPKSVEIGIPGSSVGRIIGRQGANIKRLEEQSGARCKMQDEETAGGVRMLRITGTPDAIREATRLLNRSLEEVTKGNLSFQMHVPNEAVGRIIGKNGANIKDLILASGARVDVEHKPAAGQDSSRRRIITIAGTQQQVDCAKAMIQEVVDEHYRSVAGDRRRPLGGQDDKSQPGVTRNQQRKSWTQCLTVPGRQSVAQRQLVLAGPVSASQLISFFNLCENGSLVGHDGDA
ncbi:PREDICTED: tudor and KH domain-containing protein-like [Priapulus caudatus]|uniref:Tudor and KH domain-containing protein-like n=1 Tax=Priapulus caudatus TaxID=37621 RepID=A0ABM1EKL5_PRICU|nr:PREDICTED: tudor and KH domain-containing protein-like [Priapulus caudatus]